MRFAMCGLLIVLSGVLFWQATLIEGAAGVYPMAVTGAALFFCVVYTARQAVREGRAGRGEASYAIPAPSLPQVAAFAAIWAGYVLAIPALGFILASWIALVASILAIRARIGLVDVLWPAAFVIALAVLLKVVLYVPVPQGWLDENLDILIYGLR
ncbi:MAG: tripartite tricarboxylate transporter TctB family protein [Gemmatimonadetes bacterium]|nr:tripartite tricarboxylate transporter TctB family protein [Gemmatimonadota bacterium]